MLEARRASNLHRVEGDLSALQKRFDHAARFGRVAAE
jgi:hypothetical protein